MVYWCNIYENFRNGGLDFRVDFFCYNKKPNKKEAAEKRQPLELITKLYYCKPPISNRK